MELVKLSKLIGTFDMLIEPYLDTTREHYDTAAATQVANVQSGVLTGTAYVQWALDKGDEESTRATDVLSAEVAERVVEIVRHETGELKAADVVQKGKQRKQNHPATC